MGGKNLLWAFAVAAAILFALTSHLRADVWTIETVDSTGAVGWYTSMALDSGGKAHISYLDYSNYDLKYATNASGSWTTYTVDGAESVGLYTSMALDAAGKAHISYYDTGNGDLRYATPFCMKADANVSREVNILDTILVLRLATGLDQLPDLSDAVGWCANDINGDVSIDVSDVVKALRMALGLE